MVSYARFTRSTTSTARGQRAMNRSTITLMPLLLRTRRESSATSNRNARAAYERYQAAASADDVVPPSPIRPVPMPNFDAELSPFEELQETIRRVLTERPSPSLAAAADAADAAAAAASLLVPSPAGFQGAARDDWGPRRRPAGRRIQLSRAFDNSPIRRPQFVGAQRALPFSTWREIHGFRQYEDPPSPQRDTIPASPSSSPGYSPTAPSTGPPSPFGPSWSPSSPAPAHVLDMSDLAVAIEVEPEVVAAPRQVIDLTDDSMDGSKECPIEL